MNYYQLFLNDQKWNNWLAFRAMRKPPYVLVRPRYAHLLCPMCRCYSHDDIFENGFDSGIKIRAKGDIIRTEDGFDCVNENVRSLILENSFGGLSAKAVPGTGWYVISITCRVDADRTALKFSGPACEACGRPREVTGTLNFLRQIQVPDKARSFFTPTFDRVGSFSANRDRFVTEDIAYCFKESGLKGGMFEKLLDSKEEAALRETLASGKEFKWPQIIL